MTLVSGVIVSVLTARTPRTAHKRAWTRREVLDFEAGLNVNESLDLCHIYRQSMAKGKWPVCLPPSKLNVCTSDKCFVRYTSHGDLGCGAQACSLGCCVLRSGQRWSEYQLGKIEHFRRDTRASASSTSVRAA